MANKEVAKDLAATIAEMNKEYGLNSVMTLDQKPNEVYEVIPTGSIAWDYEVLGVGGFVMGKMYEIRGWEGVGKSTICGHLTAEAQKKDLLVLYIDGEYALDINYFASLGVNIDKMLINQPSDGNEGFTIALNLIKTGKVGLVIIDSDSSLIPKDSLDNEVGASNMGKKAKLNSDVYPKLKIALSQNNTCVVVTSQYREKMGVMFGDPKTTQGGKALGFYADTIIELSKTLKKEGDEVVANIVKMKTIKNKSYSPFKMATADIAYGVGIDKIGEIIEKGNALEVLKKWGKTVTYCDKKYEYIEFLQLLQDNEDFFNDVKKKILIKYV